MKKQLLVLALALISVNILSAQYLPIAKQGRVWYSMVGYLSTSHFTTALGVEGDTLINGTLFPLLVRKDSMAATVDTLGYMDEDTVQGTLRIEFFGNRPTQHYDFNLQQGDTVYQTSYYNGVPDSALVDTVFTISDFNNVSRKVILFKSAIPGSDDCDNARQPWVEGLGAGILVDALPNCFTSHYPLYRLRCVFDGPTKIYGDTVQECYSEDDISIGEFGVQQLQVFPNPTSSTLTIATDARIKSVSIRALSGTTLIYKKPTANRLNVSELPSGLYLMEMTDADGHRAIAKFVKE